MNLEENSADKSKLWLTANEVAEILGMSKGTILLYAKQGKIQCDRINRKVLRFKQSYIKAFIQNGKCLD